MKKLLIVLVLSVVLMPVAKAQVTDTVQWKYRNYHYSPWYDTLPEFYDTVVVYQHPTWDEYGPALVMGHTLSGAHFGRIKVMPQHVERPTFVCGAAVTEPINSNITTIVRYPWHLPEYVYLFQKSKDSIVLCDSARWDTITPKVMKIALNADTQRWGFEHMYVYEAMFSNPVQVDSTFYIVSSNNGANAYDGGSFYTYQYLPVETVTIGYVFNNPGTSWCPLPSWYRPKIWDPQTGAWSDLDYPVQRSPRFGSYFPIVDYVDLVVTSTDTAKGTAGPVALVSRNSTQLITATPRHGYRFSHWQDGVDSMPMYVYINRDTTCFTAYFEAADSFSIGGYSGDGTMGHVEGAGVYYEGDTARLLAVPEDRRYLFDHWDNGSTDNPLEYVVRRDTTFTAYFTAVPVYTVNAQSNNDRLGYVTGGGIYYEGDEVVIEAVAYEGGRFERWNDLVTDNPRSLVVTQDMSFSAIFKPVEQEGMVEAVADGRLFRLAPNPASGDVRFETEGEGFEGGVLTVSDAAGREVLRRELSAGTRRATLEVSGLPAGTYFVTLTTAAGTGTRRLVID